MDGYMQGKRETGGGRKTLCVRSRRTKGDKEEEQRMEAAAKDRRCTLKPAGNGFHVSGYMADSIDGVQCTHEYCRTPVLIH